MARSSPHSCEDDIEIMIRTGVRDWRHVESDRYKWPQEAILVVQSNRLNEINHSKPKHINGRAQHVECAFLDEIESADQSLSLEDYFSKMRMRQQKTEYDLYINYSPCVDCADRIIEFINNHPLVIFNIHYAMTYKDGDGLRKLKYQEGITLSTMSDSNWKSVTTSLLDIHIQKMQKLQEEVRSKPGYESLNTALKYLDIERFPKWITMRKEADEVHDQILHDIFEEEEYFEEYWPEEYFEEYWPEEYFEEYWPEEYFEEYWPEEYFEEYWPEEYFEEYWPEEVSEDEDEVQDEILDDTLKLTPFEEYWLANGSGRSSFDLLYS
ncbi:uncharacterized protein LOC117288461 [Asterias rubens]|uniref:uncharacterized protein LOC117288461 n=1 Tax=Asterias rubens TaxID=7604 RepID=UPI00145542E9|nr:uncharacterized protein LOC117288461 [Asterias rubens]XP_033625229.1 uncharacterized protein LOC117288461 [Asterias rubens]